MRNPQNSADDDKGVHGSIASSSGGSTWFELPFLDRYENVCMRDVISPVADSLTVDMNLSSSTV